MQSLQSREFSRILLIKPSALGDVVNALPVLPKLRARYPQAQIDWLVTPENALLVERHPALSNVVLFDRRKFSRVGRDWAATREALGWLSALRRARYDLVVDLGGQLRTALFCLATGAPVRLGLEMAREGAGIVYTHRAPVPSYDIHAVDRYLSVAGVLGLDDKPPDFRIYLADDVEARVQQLLSEQGLAEKPFALLAPGTIWETKHWTEAGFAAVGRQLLERGLAVVLAGSPGDRARTQVVAANCPGAIDLAGRTSVAELLALIRRAALCVTNDSGAMHLAVAQQRPVVSIFGPTSPLRNGPYGRPEAVVR
ncbi:MAG TPA: glycosyltransferase family 9 protein, partial [Pirellulales bacterium]|nr:glycosyltransferase family 9 protein [Pirellulales bacterium]